MNLELGYSEEAGKDFVGKEHAARGKTHHALFIGEQLKLAQLADYGLEDLHSIAAELRRQSLPRDPCTQAQAQEPGFFQLFGGLSRRTFLAARTAQVFGQHRGVAEAQRGALPGCGPWSARPGQNRGRAGGANTSSCAATGSRRGQSLRSHIAAARAASREAMALS